MEARAISMKILGVGQSVHPLASLWHFAKKSFSVDATMVAMRTKVILAACATAKKTMARLTARARSWG